MLIKDQIRARREALGMNMSELATRVGVTEQAVRHWESGRSYPRKPMIPLLEEALSFRMDWHEGMDPDSERRTAAAMIDQRDVDLLMVICKLPLRAKKLFGDLARMHLDAVERARPDVPHSSDTLAAVRAAVASSIATTPQQQTSPPPTRSTRKSRA